MIDCINRVYNCDVMDIICDIPDRVFDLLILDFPYNLQKDFENDNLTPSDFRQLLRLWIKSIIPKLKDTGSLYCFMGYDYYDYLKLLLSKYLIFRREIIWTYQHLSNPNLNNNYLPQFDKILYFVKSENFTFNNIRTKPLKWMSERFGKHADKDGRVPFDKLPLSYRKKYVNEENYAKKKGYNINRGKLIGNVLYVPKVHPQSNEKSSHPTQKPESLIETFIKISSNENDLVSDLFAGSGTTLAVAKRLRRNYFGTEVKKEYYEMITKRLGKTHQIQNIMDFMQ